MNTNSYLPKLLIVDDYPANLNAMKKLLAGEEAIIFTASSGNEALTLCLNHDFSLILLDVQMDGMDGFETAELIRSNDSTSTTPIIFLTANNKEMEDVFRGYDSGAVDYLFKPLEPLILLSKVAIFLELSRQRNALETARQELLREAELRTQTEEEKNTLIAKLKLALAEVKSLQGILPICSNCHKIKNDKGAWQKLELYISEHSEATFSHGMCKQCCDKLYGNEEWYTKKS